MKHFINLKDIPSADLKKIIADAKKRKQKRKNYNTLEIDKDKPLKGKLLIQMFEKASLRTRLSFYLAIKQLGGGTITLRANELHLGKGGESLADTAKILSTYGDGFMLRTDSDEKIAEFSKYLKIPVINGLSPSSHPTQVLSDIFTVEEIKKNINESLQSFTEAELKLKEAGFTMRDFLMEYGDKQLLGENNLKENKGGFVVGGFEMIVPEDIDKALADIDNKGIVHPQFNGKLPSTGNNFLF